MVAAKINNKRLKSEHVTAYSKEEIKAMMNHIDKAYPYCYKTVKSVSQGVYGTLGNTRRKRLGKLLLNKQLKALIILALETGLRREELFNLKVADVQDINETIYVVGKGYKERSVPFTDVAKQAMNTWLWHRDLAQPLDDQCLWIQTTRMLGSAVSYSQFQKWGQLMGDKPVKLHRFRHSFGTVNANAGMPLHILREIMGHSNLAVTSKYINTTADECVEATNLIANARAKMYGII